MRRVALVAVVVALARAGDAGASEPCELPGFRTIRASEHARVLQKGNQLGDRRWWGCLLGRDRLVRLDREDVAEVLYRFRLAGRFVGFVARGTEGAHQYESPVAHDLRSGRVARSAPSTIPEESVGTGQVAELRITSRGWLVWVSCHGSRCGRTDARHLFRYDSRGVKRLDRGPLMHKHSLRVYRGTLVKWRHAEEWLTATLR